MGFNVTGISTYTDQLSQELIYKALLNGRTLELVDAQTDVKYKQALNILTNTITVADATCGFDGATGDVAFTQRDIEVKPLEVKDTLCMKTLESYWQGQLMAAGTPKDVDMGEVLAESYVQKIQNSNELTIWKGLLSGSTGATGQDAYGKFNGFVQVLSQESTRTIVSGGATAGELYGLTAGNAVSYVNGMVSGMPQDLWAYDSEDPEDGIMLFLGTDEWNTYTQALVTANLFHYDGMPTNGIIQIPGTTVKAVRTPGLNGTKYRILTFAKNLVVGTDLMNEEEKFDIWYSRDNDQVRVNIQWKMGTQVKYPDLVVTNFKTA